MLGVHDLGPVPRVIDRDWRGYLDRTVCIGPQRRRPGRGRVDTTRPAYFVFQPLLPDASISPEVAAMRAEMRKKYWRNLAEAAADRPVHRLGTAARRRYDRGEASGGKAEKPGGGTI